MTRIYPGWKQKWNEKRVYKARSKKVNIRYVPRTEDKDDELFQFLQELEQEASDKLRHQFLWQAIHVKRHEREWKLGKKEYDYVKYVEYVGLAWHLGGKVERRVITTLWS